MQKVTVRYPEDFAAYVRRAAKQRGVREPSVWRELVALGIQRREANDGLLNTVFSLTVQNLCTCRRIAGRILDRHSRRFRDNCHRPSFRNNRPADPGNHNRRCRFVDPASYRCLRLVFPRELFHGLFLGLLPALHPIAAGVPGS